MTHQEIKRKFDEIVDFRCRRKSILIAIARTPKEEARWVL